MKTAQVTDWSSAYSRFRPDVLSFLSRRLWGRQELAEDLAQETFARALKAGTPIRDPSTIRSYLLQIANHVFVSHVRRKSRVTSESHDFAALHDQDDIAQRADVGGGAVSQGRGGEHYELIFILLLVSFF